MCSCSLVELSDPSGLIETDVRYVPDLDVESVSARSVYL